MEGLCEKIIGPQIHAHELIQISCAAGDDNDGNLGALPQCPADVIAVVQGQVQIQQDQMGA